MSNKNIFDSKRRETISRRDVVEGLGALSRHYDNEVSSANNRANNAESRVELSMLREKLKINMKGAIDRIQEI